MRELRPGRRVPRSYGHRRLIRITMVIVAIGSVITATAGSTRCSGSRRPASCFMATPSELGFGFGYGPLGLGLMGLPASIGALADSMVSDRLVGAWGARPVVIGGIAARSPA
ncbi:hypothetical protein AB0F72_20475 [Actinoplanes sp. NPDC023936]|uniref:hypothetical protein n=1 Tax=Actinoplanes sp. NPDC023936 TaxID=3154910 RepID=UPI0033E04A8D